MCWKGDRLTLFLLWRLWFVGRSRSEWVAQPAWSWLRPARLRSECWETSCRRGWPCSALGPRQPSPRPCKPWGSGPARVESCRWRPRLWARPCPDLPWPGRCQTCREENALLSMEQTTGLVEKDVKLTTWIPSTSQASWERFRGCSYNPSWRMRREPTATTPSGCATGRPMKTMNGAAGYTPYCWRCPAFIISQFTGSYCGLRFARARTTHSWRIASQYSDEARISAQAKCSALNAKTTWTCVLE